jgi:TonB family protein
LRRFALTIAIIGAVALAVEIFSPRLTDSQSAGNIAAPSKASQKKAIPFHPNGVAIQVSVVPGAIVCQDLVSVHLVWGLYVNYWTDAMQDQLTNGGSRVLRGPSSPEPDPKVYGCALLAAGAPVEFEQTLPGIVHVTSKLADGHFVRGVTQENMIRAISEKENDPSQQQGSVGRKAQAPASKEEPMEGQANESQTDSTARVGDGPFVPGQNGVSFPRCLYCPDPGYSEDGRAAGVVGTVSLRIVIEADGRPADIQVVKGLGHGLDELAVRAVQAWRFKPATGPNGSQVPTTVPVEINFRLK